MRQSGVQGAGRFCSGALAAEYDIHVMNGFRANMLLYRGHARVFTVIRTVHQNTSWGHTRLPS